MFLVQTTMHLHLKDSMESTPSLNWYRHLSAIFEIFLWCVLEQEGKGERWWKETRPHSKHRHCVSFSNDSARMGSVHPSPWGTFWVTLVVSGRGWGIVCFVVGLEQSHVCIRTLVISPVTSPHRTSQLPTFTVTQFWLSKVLFQWHLRWAGSEWTPLYELSILDLLLSDIFLHLRSETWTQWMIKASAAQGRLHHWPFFKIFYIFF